MAFFAQTTASFCKNCDHYIGFLRKTPIFCRKLGKIAENCVHNIDPWSFEKRPYEAEPDPDFEEKS
jgi:hypothetical protein